MTKAEAMGFIRKLKSYQESKANKILSKPKENLHILEPKAFDMILRELKPKKLLELNRICNSCSQICNKLNIEYTADSWDTTLKSWDGDIIIGFSDIKKCKGLLTQGLHLLQEGRFLALCQRISFFDATSRYYDWFKKTPFQRLYCPTVRPYVSKTGRFSDGRDVSYYDELMWYVWIGGSDIKNPTIHWLEDLDEYYLFDPSGSKMREKFNNSNNYKFVYKKPIIVYLDDIYKH